MGSPTLRLGRPGRQDLVLGHPDPHVQRGRRGHHAFDLLDPLRVADLRLAEHHGRILPDRHVRPLGRPAAPWQPAAR